MCQDLWYLIVLVFIFLPRPWLFPISQGVMQKNLARAVKDQQITVQSYSRKRLRRHHAERTLSPFCFFVMADAVNLPEPKGLPTLLGLNQNVVWDFFGLLYVYGLKGWGLFWWRVHTMEKKTGTNLEAFIGFRLIPKIVFERKRRRQPSETQKIAWQMNDIHWWNSFLGESIFRQRFSSFGFFFLR